uniref:Coenzyme Q-binding protein COQ10 START domain-containing protein n=1 Tax=Leptobrachium leishanense TaxID=445787 RepID=A0A8C5WDP1_9ANUR
MASPRGGTTRASALLRALLESDTRPALTRTARPNPGVRHGGCCGVLTSDLMKLPRPSPVQIQAQRSFLNLAAPLLGSKRINYSESKTLGYSVKQMFDIVSNVENYKLFVPWCKGSKVLSRNKGVTKAELEVGFPPFMERYVSDISVIPQHQVRAVCSDGKMFSHLETMWRFSPGKSGNSDTCTLDFYVSFEFKSLLHSHLASLFFDEVSKQMVSAFENQAARTYGQRIIPLKAAQCRATR